MKAFYRLTLKVDINVDITIIDVSWFEKERRIGLCKEAWVPEVPQTS